MLTDTPFGNPQDLAARIRKTSEDPNNPVATAFGVWVTRIILERTKSTIRYEETDWDSSSFGRATNEPFDPATYSSVEQFLEDEPTGNTQATYVSGMGFAADYFRDDAYTVVFSLFSQYLKCDVLGLDIVELDHEREYQIEKLEDWLCGEGVDGELLAKPVLAMDLQECVNKFREQAIEEKRLEDELDAARLAERTLTRAALRAEAGIAVQFIEERAMSQRWTKDNWGCNLLQAT